MFFGTRSQDHKPQHAKAALRCCDEVNGRPLDVFSGCVRFSGFSLVRGLPGRTSRIDTFFDVREKESTETRHRRLKLKKAGCNNHIICIGICWNCSIIHRRVPLLWGGSIVHFLISFKKEDHKTKLQSHFDHYSATPRPLLLTDYG